MTRAKKLVGEKDGGSMTRPTSDLIAELQRFDCGVIGVGLEAADRLSSILKAWEAYDGLAVQDVGEQMRVREALERAITGTSTEVRG